MEKGGQGEGGQAYGDGKYFEKEMERSSMMKGKWLRKRVDKRTC